MHRADQSVSPKVTAATVGSLAASIIVALLLGLASDPSPLDQLPGALRVFLLAVIPAAVTALSGYAKADPLRQLGARQVSRDALELPKG